MKAFSICICLGVLLVGLTTACSSTKSADNPEGVAPPPAVTGPDYLRGTVGSLCRIRGYSATLVSGYGIVAMPRGSGTGSAEVPAFLRQWMLQEMRRRGFGQAKYRMRHLSAEEFLASEDTAVVSVQGLIPPGAKRGTKFDLLVNALPATQTTSLRGGRLFMTELSVGGMDRSLAYRKPIARGGGETYVNPFSADTSQEQARRISRQAVVLTGGVVLEDRPLELVLNAPDWARSRAIADRINERFPAAPGSKYDTAEPATDRRIRLTVAERYADNPGEFLSLISKVYLQRITGFEQAKASELLTIAQQRPETRGDIHYALVALGKTITPLLREQYDHPDLDYRLMMLRTGVRLEDGQAVLALADLADHPEPAFRVRVIDALAFAPKNLRAQRVLTKQLSDPADEVRIAAYEKLVEQQHPLVQRVPIGDGNRVRFMLDLINGQDPMVFVAQRDLPRIVIFGANTPFRTPLFAEFQGGRLMLRAMEPSEPVAVFHQPRAGGESKTYEIAPTVANLAFLLGHKSNPSNRTAGLDMSYGETVNIIYQLHQKGLIPGKLELQISPLAQTIATLEDEADAQPDSRPETDEEGEDDDGTGSDDGPFIPLDRQGQPGDTVPEGNDAPEASEPAPSRPDVGS